MVFNEVKIGLEQESVSMDSDTEYVQLECSNEQHNSESFHEEAEKEEESPQKNILEGSNGQHRQSKMGKCN